MQGALRQLRDAYLEVSGLRLTPPVLERTLELDHATSEALLETLYDTNFLRRAVDGSFELADEKAVWSTVVRD